MARTRDTEKTKVMFNLRNELIARIDKEAGSMGIDRTAFVQMTLTMYFAGKDGLDAIQWARAQQELQKVEVIKA